MIWPLRMPIVTWLPAVVLINVDSLLAVLLNMKYKTCVVLYCVAVTARLSAYKLGSCKCPKMVSQIARPIRPCVQLPFASVIGR